MSGLALSSLTNRLIRESSPVEVWDSRACKNLLMAILERAIQDLVADTRYLRPLHSSDQSRVDRYQSGMSQNARNALYWIMDDRREDTASYNRICALVGIDKHHLRNPATLAKVVTYYTKNPKE